MSTQGSLWVTGSCWARDLTLLTGRHLCLRPTQCIYLYCWLHCTAFSTNTSLPKVKYGKSPNTVKHFQYISFSPYPRPLGEFTARDTCVTNSILTCPEERHGPQAVWSLRSNVSKYLSQLSTRDTLFCCPSDWQHSAKMSTARPHQCETERSRSLAHFLSHFLRDLWSGKMTWVTVWTVDIELKLDC